MITLYWSPQTRASRILWLLEEAGVAHERVTIDIRDAAAKADPAFRAASPMGKVPAIVDGDTRLWDSGAIALHVADSYPESGLGVPVGDPRRGAFVQWTVFTNSVIEPAMTEKYSGAEQNTTQNGFGSFDQMIDVLVDGMRRADGPWLLGSQFTVADVLVGSSVHFLQVFGGLPERTELLAYLEQCRARPAFQRAMAADGA